MARKWEDNVARTRVDGVHDQNVQHRVRTAGYRLSKISYMTDKGYERTTGSLFDCVSGRW